METVSFRFYEELNDFLAPPHRRREFCCGCAHAAPVKHVIEQLGVPHTEVELVLVNGESVGFDRVLQAGDRISVYPKFEAFDVKPLLRVREATLRTIRFVADAHLGGLARLLRMIGFDTVYLNALRDEQVEELARQQQRIVLTRDRALLKRRGITHGCYVRALHPRPQLREVFERLDLARAMRPFTRCLSCNGALRAVDPQCVDGRVPPSVRERHARFAMCDGCARVFWEGTHWRRMRQLVDELARSGVREGV